MRFSIIVPIYNTEKYLSACIESILGQSFDDYEIILVDDGSTDGSARICREYAAKDSRIKTVFKENGGSTSARKAGLAVASGDYIMTVDADDWIADGLLCRVSDAIDLYACDLICYNLCIVTGNEMTEFRHNHKEKLYMGNEIDEIRAGYLYDARQPRLNIGTLGNSMCTKVTKRGIFETAIRQIPEDIAMGEDILFTLPVLEQSTSAYMTDFIGYYYRQNLSSKTHTVSFGAFEELYRLASLIAASDGEGKKGYGIKACVHSVYRSWDYLRDLALSVRPRSKYVKQLRSAYPKEMDAFTDVVIKTRPCYKDRLKLGLIRRHRWGILFFFFNFQQKRGTVR